MKNMGFSHSPFKKLGFWASNVGNNSPAPSDRFHRLRHWLSRNFWNIKTLGWTNGKKAQSYFCILLLPIYLKLFGFRSPVMFCGFRFASHVTARAFEISVRRRRSGSWQLRYGTIFRGFNSQLGMVTFCLRLFSGLLHYCRRQIKTWTCSCPALKSLRLGVSANLLHWVLKNPIQTPPMDEHTSWQWLGD